MIHVVSFSNWLIGVIMGVVLLIKANELCVIRDPCEVPCKVKKKKPPCAPKKRCVKKHPANKKNMLLFPLFPIHGAYIYPLAPKC